MAQTENLGGLGGGHMSLVPPVPTPILLYRRLYIYTQLLVSCLLLFTDSLPGSYCWWFDPIRLNIGKMHSKSQSSFVKDDEHFIKYLLLMHYHRTTSVYPSKIFTVNVLPYNSPLYRKTHLCVTPFLVGINLLFMEPPLCSTSSHLNTQLVDRSWVRFLLQTCSMYTCWQC